MLTGPWCFTNASSIDCVTCDRIVEIAVTVLWTIESKGSEWTFLFTMFAGPTSTACANSRLWIASTIVPAIAWLFTIFTECTFITWSIAMMTYKPNPRIRRTFFLVNSSKYSESNNSSLYLSIQLHRSTGLFQDCIFHSYNYISVYNLRRILRHIVFHSFYL